MASNKKVLFTGSTHTAASDGGPGARKAHGRLDLKTSASGSGTNQQQDFIEVLAHPTAEQLFAAAWSACYYSAMGVIGQMTKQEIPADMAVEIEIDLVQAGMDYSIEARFHVSLPGLPEAEAEALAHKAHEICPYSKATRGNIDVAVRVSV